MEGRNTRRVVERNTRRVVERSTRRVAEQSNRRVAERSTRRVAERLAGLRTLGLRRAEVPQLGSPGLACRPFLWCESKQIIQKQL